MEEQSLFKDNQIFPINPTSDAVRDLATSITNLLTSDVVSRDSKHKLDILNLVQYLLHSPRNKVPSELFGSDLVEALLSDIFKKNGEITCICKPHEVHYFTEAVIGSSLESNLKNDLMLMIIKNCLTCMTNNVCQFLCHLWQMQDNIPLNSDALEKIALGLPLCLEKTLLHFAQEALQAEDNQKVELILENSNVRSFLQLCTTSEKVFQNTVTILHQLLLISNVNPQILLLIKTFIRYIKDACQNVFLELFPIEQQALVFYLQIDPEFYSTTSINKEFNRTYILTLIIDGLQQNRRATGAILTYFPEWFPFVQDYCVTKNLTEFLPASEAVKCPIGMFQSHLLS